MNKFALTALILLAPALASAEIAKGGKFDRYTVHFESSQPAKLQVKTKYTTKDACNAFGLAGDFRKLEGQEEFPTIVQDFVGDFSIMSTQVFCDPGPEKTLTLTSDERSVSPIGGWIYVNVLIPEGYELLVKP